MNIKDSLKRTLKVLKKAEWSFVFSGPPSAQGRDDGFLHNACPICRGVKRTNVASYEFCEEAIGHKKGCDLKKTIEDISKRIKED